MTGLTSRMVAATSLVALSCFPTLATAFDRPDWTQGWDSRATLYGWLPSITGSQERLDGAPLVDLSGAKILDMFDVAFLGSVETRRANWGLLFTLEVGTLGQDGEWRAYRLNTHVETKITMATAALTYRLYDSPDERSFVDLLGGLRVYDVSSTFKVDSTRYAQEFSASSAWVDPLIGLRAEAPLGKRISATLGGDVAGFGIGGASDLTWEVYGGVHYDFNARTRGLVGYRYMAIDHTSDDLILDVDIHGPVIGLSYTF